MTIHAAKGLEFPVVVVADLGRGPAGRAPRILVDGDRAGLRVTTLERERFDALDYDELKDERARGASAARSGASSTSPSRAPSGG